MEQRQRGRPEHSADPEVSIIILVLEDVTRLLSCLASIRATSGDVTHEIIVVGNGTAPQVLDRVVTAGVKVIPLRFNVGFAAGCNVGARAARGELLVFLNDDTSVNEGWLSNLVSGAKSSDEIGAVGSKLVNSDGSPQEAGGVVWRSGRTDRVSAQLPSELLDVTRDVEYASACGLLVKRRAFWLVGGFDEAYFPAYYEDVDLCFSLRAAGSRVVYEPRAVVVHEGSVSSKRGYRDFAAERNRRLFASKWRSELDQRDSTPSEDELAEAVTRAALRPPGPKTPVLQSESEAAITEFDECQLSLLSRAGLEREAALQACYIDELETQIANIHYEHDRLAYLRKVLRWVPFARRLGRWAGERATANEKDSEERRSGTT